MQTAIYNWARKEPERPRMRIIYLIESHLTATGFHLTRTWFNLLRANRLDCFRCPHPIQYELGDL